MRKHSYAEEALRFYGALQNTQNVVDTNIRRSMANCHRQLSLLRLAARYYESVVVDEPRNIETRLDLGRIYEELGEIQKAFEHVSYAIKVRRAQAVAAARVDLAEFNPDTILQDLPDPVEAAGITATTTSVHILLTKLAASMPKRPWGRSAKAVERLRTSTADTQGMYTHMLTLLPRMRGGDKEAETEWMEFAIKTLADFRSEKVFFPTDRYIKFLGYSAEARRRATKPKALEPKNEIEVIADRLQIALGKIYCAMV